MQGDGLRPMLCGDLLGLLSPSGKAVHHPAKALIAAAHGEHRVQESASPGATRERGSSGLSSLLYVSWSAFCGGGGGVVGGEEGVDQPGVGWCVVVSGGEGVVSVVHEGPVGGGCWLPVVGGGDVARDPVPEVAQGSHTFDSHVLPSHAMVSVRVVLGAAGPAALVVGGAVVGVHPPGPVVSEKLLPRVAGGHRDIVCWGGGALAVMGGERGVLVSSNFDEGVEEAVSDALPQGGHQGGVNGGEGCPGCVWGLAMGFPLVAPGGAAPGGVRRRGLGLQGVGGGLRVLFRWSGPGLGAGT